MCETCTDYIEGRYIWVSQGKHLWRASFNFKGTNVDVEFHKKFFAVINKDHSGKQHFLQPCWCPAQDRFGSWWISHSRSLTTVYCFLKNPTTSMVKTASDTVAHTCPTPYHHPHSLPNPIKTNIYLTLWYYSYRRGSYVVLYANK